MDVWNLSSPHTTIQKYQDWKLEMASSSSLMAWPSSDIYKNSYVFLILPWRSEQLLSIQFEKEFHRHWSSILPWPPSDVLLSFTWQSKIVWRSRSASKLKNGFIVCTIINHSFWLGLPECVYKCLLCLYHCDDPKTWRSCHTSNFKNSITIIHSNLTI